MLITQKINLIIITAILMVISLPGYGQQLSIKGMVTDSTSSEILEDASLYLFKLPQWQPLRSIQSGKQFLFSGLDSGSYILVTHFQGYLPDSLAFYLTFSDSLCDGFNIMLKRIYGSLLQVVVRASVPPAILRKDTIAFNVDAYPSPPNSTVEDMLRKLPGIIIDSKGNVTMQGQKVDRITINGKEFFLNDLRSASQNLPADLVAKVEVYDTKLKNAKLGGSGEKSETKTINLRLKKKTTGELVGKVYTGFGPSGSYTYGGNASRFDSSQMFFLYGNANNINNQFTGNDHVNGSGSGKQVLNNLQASYRTNWSNQLSSTVSCDWLSGNARLFQQLRKQTALTDSTLLQYSGSEIKNVNSNYGFDVILEYSSDPLTKWTLYSDFRQQSMNSHVNENDTLETIRNTKNYLSSLGQTENQVFNSGFAFNNSISFSHQFKKKGRAFYSSAGILMNPQTQSSFLFSKIQNFDSRGESVPSPFINLRLSQLSCNNYYTINASYMEPLGHGQVADFSYAGNYANSYSVRLGHNYDSLTGSYDQPDSSNSSRFKNYFFTHSVGLGFAKTDGKYQYQVGVAGQFNGLANRNLLNDQRISQQTLEWIPRASLLCNIGKKENLYLAYWGYVTPPTTEQLQPVQDLSNPYLIKFGNPNLKQQFSHTFLSRYTSFNPKSFQSWQLLFSGDFIQNEITGSSTVLNGGIQELKYINVQGSHHISGNITFGFPLNHQKNGNASLNIHGQRSRDISMVNDQYNITSTTGFGVLAAINYRYNNELFFDSKITMDQTFSNYSLRSSAPVQQLFTECTLNANYRLPFGLTITNYLSLQFTGRQSNQSEHTVLVWNASVYRAAFKHGEFRISGFNMLNKKMTFYQSTGDNYSQALSNSLPGTIFLSSFIYRIR